MILGIAQGKGRIMKRLVICVLALGLLFGGVARAEECQLGVYLGVKFGVGIAKQSKTAFGMDAATVTEGGDTFSWDHHRIGMGNNSDAVVGGGASLGYDFSKRLSIPLRLELDYTILADAKDTTRNTGTFNIMYNGTPMSFQSELEVQTKIRLQTMMLNAWVDIPTGTKLTPYFGGGIGTAFIRHKSTAIEEPGTPAAEVVTASKSFNNFAWSVGGGVAYAINDRWTMDLGYRYTDAGSHKMNYSGEGGNLYTRLNKIKSHNIMLGLRRTF